MVTNPFAGLFGHSPFKPLQQHMRAAVKCAGEVPSLFDALYAGDDAGVTAAKERIFALEQEADDIKNAMRSHLPKSLMMPVNRGDLLSMLQMQDRISGTAQDIAGFLTTRKMPAIPEMKETISVLTRRCADTCVKAGEVVDLLDELVETGFSGRQSQAASELVDELCAVEAETDRMAVAAVKVLFENEDKMSHTDVVFWYQMIEWISNLADNAEHVGNRLRLMIAH